MKKTLAAVLVALSLAVGGQAMVPSSVCYAEVHYANGDANYPIWAAGSHYGGTYDLSSCFVFDEDSNYVVVKTIGYAYSWAGHELTKPSDLYFRMDKSSHKVWFRLPNEKWHNAGIFDDAILLAFSQVGKL